MLRFPRHRSLSANPFPVAPPVRHRHVIADLLQITAYTVFLLMIGTTLLPRYTIQQTSMEPNFHPGQRVVVSRAERTFNNWISGAAYAANPESIPIAGLHPGQIIIFYETAERTGSPLIKRLIGMPGDEIELRKGAVFINGTLLTESYLSATTATVCVDTCHLTLGANEYFFLGDNRPISRDSRQFGAVPADQIVGRVVVRFWPLDQFTLFF